MKLETIHEEWQKDCVISDDITRESLMIDQLKFKYRKWFSRETLILIQKQNELKTLRLEKYEMYTQGASKEHIAKGWKLPPVGKVMKTEVGQYLDADAQIIEANLNIALQAEKSDLLHDILKALDQRQWNIKNAIDHKKFEAGLLS